ncbi:M14 family zinc carboxypeptidase [Xanthovirga aplysinae]|uniref:M14 family zinc carboxypeptidase n=1 Tax=Xanthovirga aplysinae TaxID=2529853 RepID=UPI0012BC26E1|nr:M14 family zinc carboxypeptidase [Xanthovirga aplysinae]MTI30839.1 zinc carboxypeptidase [Xanthovirga aplysinae]
MKGIFTLLLFFCFMSSHLPAQNAIEQKYYLPIDVTYDPNVPTPEEVLGYQVGKWHVRPDQVLAYFRALAGSSDRVILEEHGKTYEDRPIILAIVTSSQNHNELDELKKKHVQLTDPAKSSDLDISSMPVVLYQGFSVHGNEPSGTNASLLYAYYLAAAQGPEIEEKLDNAIILIDPSLNPDGLGRFAQWANMYKSPHPVADPNNRDHREGWPAGRTNHYWFDLNRDWLPVQHPESQARIRKFHEWKPNILTDHHEMGANSTFFFQPGIPSRTHPLTPKKNVDLTHKMAKFHSEALDKIGSLYYSEESFDDFYYGKGSTYPDVNGTVGILFEQGGSQGHLIETVNGKLAFPFTIKNQLTTALSTLQSAVSLRKEFLEYQRDFYTSALNLSSKDPVKAYLFGASDLSKLQAFNAILLQHKIEVRELKGAFSYKNRDFEAGKAYAVPLNQAQYRLIHGIFEKRTEFTDSLFYDVSGWTLPLAFNLEYAELNQKALSRLKLGDPLMSVPVVKGQVVGGKSEYAYVFRWGNYYAPKLLNKLLTTGLRAKVATKPFSVSLEDGVHSFKEGDILLPVANQKMDAEGIFKFLENVTKENGLDVYGITSGLTPEGIDLGSRSFAAISKPKIGLLIGSGVRAYDAGEVWHLLAERFETEVTLLDLSYFSSVDISRYNTLVMVDGSYKGMNEKAQGKLRDWLNKGGNLVAMKRAVKWLKDKKFLSLKWKTKEKDSVYVMKTYADLEKAKGAQVIGGTIFQVSIDPTHPLGYGYSSKSLPVFKNDTLFAAPTSNAYATPMIYSQDPLLSGYISKENAAIISGAAAATIHSQGRGKIIALADNPNFRAFWYGTNRLFFNAIYFGRTISSSATQKFKKIKKEGRTVKK